MRGIVACEALYNLVERFCPDAAVRYVPAELHEFPVNVPLEGAIADRVQAAIDELDELDEQSLDAIVVSYATSGPGEWELSASTPLVVSDAADCVSTVLPERENEYGENKAPNTLYLTRGWIDCGVDCYKLYRAYRGDVDALVGDFEEAAARHSDLRYSWYRGDRFERAVDRLAAASEGIADEFFHSVVRYYDRVVLVDTGDLYEFHHDYAGHVRWFVERLRREYGDGGGGGDVEVQLTVTDGQTYRFEALLAGEPSRE